MRFLPDFYEKIPGARQKIRENARTIINIAVGIVGGAGGAAVFRILMFTDCKLSLGLRIVFGEMESKMVEFEAEWSKRCKDL